MPDWKKMKAEYIRGGVSYRKLADKYHVSFSTLTKVATREKWTDLRKKTGKIVDTKLSESAAGQEAKRVDIIDSIADELLQRIREGIKDKSIFTTHKFREITGAIKDLKEIKGDGDISDKTIRVIMPPELEGLGR